MKSRLLALHPDWHVWTDWYEDRYHGRPANEALEIARATLPEELWAQGPRAVNARIAELIAEHAPKEPPNEPGLHAEVRNGKLELRGSAPAANETADPLQQSLHEIVRRKARDMHAALKPAANQYPELFKVATTYLKTVEVPLAELDVTAAWSEGNELDGLLHAYSGQDANRTMSEPLEPALSGRLDALLKDHSALILGFALGRLLTERADRMRMEGLLPDELRRPLLDVLSAFRDLREVIEPATRERIEAAEAAIIETNWRTGRVAYSGYALVRTLLIGAGRFLLKMSVVTIGLFGGLPAIGGLAGDPQLLATYQFALLFRDHAAAILQFAAGFPELRRWCEHVLAHLRLDDEINNGEDEPN